MARKRQARKCSSRRSTDGEPCGAWAVNGSTVCQAHGASAPQVKAKAAERATEEQARAQLARLDVAPVEDPLSELAKVCAQVIAWKDSMAEKVNALSSLRYSTEGGEQLRAEVALWERALDRCERFLTAMARLNIDERLAKISEERAELIITVLTIALERAGIEGEQFDTVLTEFDTAFARQAGVTL
jgi:hypothetical protein